MLRSLSAFKKFTWGFLGYTLLVVVWGGFVRASGAGAGCGDHWPLCNGEVIPHSPALNTIIEFSHRLTSGLAGLLSILLVVWALMAFGRKSVTFKASLATLFFMILEAGIGAGLVLFEYVAYNPSIARAYWMGTHLVNTFFLLAAMVLTAWAAYGGQMPRYRKNGKLGWMALASLAALVVLGASGAITALGDTLAIGGAIDPSQNAVVGALTGLRIYHPLLACAVVLLMTAAVYLRRKEPISDWGSRFGSWVIGLMLLQLTVGLVNVSLHAPIWIQLVHLLVTDLIWICAVLFAAESTNDNAKA